MTCQNIQSPQNPLPVHNSQKIDSKYLRGFAMGTLATSTLVVSALAINYYINSGKVTLSDVTIAQQQHELPSLLYKTYKAASPFSEAAVIGSSLGGLAGLYKGCYIFRQSLNGDRGLLNPLIGITGLVKSTLEGIGVGAFGGPMFLASIIAAFDNHPRLYR